MPKEAIDLVDLLYRIMSEEIKPDLPLICYNDSNGNEFFVFQNAGLNILLGNEGNGKTKYLTEVCIRILKDHIFNTGLLKDYRLLYVDTERPESQYAFSIKHISDNVGVKPAELAKMFHFLAVSELKPKEICTAITSHFDKSPNGKYVIIIDHILPLVNDMNNISEANEIDQFLKRLIFERHILLVSIHKPSNGILKGLGHLGSTLQRLASFILEIKNDEGGEGYKLKQVKSRICALDKNEMLIGKDSKGNIETGCEKVVSIPIRKDKDKEQQAKKILERFLKESHTQKKELLELIKEVMDYSPKSSSANDFYNKHLENYIQFDGSKYNLTTEWEELNNDKR